MIYVKIGIVIDEDDAEFDDVINKIKDLDGVDEVEVDADSYHEYNVDSDPWWEDRDDD
jgi:translation elongation factor EF-1beta